MAAPVRQPSIALLPLTDSIIAFCVIPQMSRYIEASCDSSDRASRPSLSRR